MAKLVICIVFFCRSQIICGICEINTERRLVGEMVSASDNRNTYDNQENTREVDEDHDSILWQAFDSRVNASTVENHEAIDCSLELKLYYREAILARKEDPLQWWKEHKAKYPVLAKVARNPSNICCIRESLFEGWRVDFQKKKPIKVEECGYFTLPKPTQLKQRTCTCSY